MPSSKPPELEGETAIHRDPYKRTRHYAKLCGYDETPEGLLCPAKDADIAILNVWLDELDRKQMHDWQQRTRRNFLGKVTFWMPCELGMLMLPMKNGTERFSLEYALDQYTSIPLLWEAKFPNGRLEGTLEDGWERAWFDQTGEIETAIYEGPALSKDGVRIFWKDALRWAVSQGADFPPKWVKVATSASPDGTHMTVSPNTPIPRRELIDRLMAKLHMNRSAATNRVSNAERKGLLLFMVDAPGLFQPKSAMTFLESQMPPRTRRPNADGNRVRRGGKSDLEDNLKVGD